MNINPYCEYVRGIKDKSNLHKRYHDTMYGFPLHSDDELFGRLILEINQAGLSWTTILKRMENFRHAYDNFEIKKVANYTDKDIQRLLNNPGIIRNKLKVNAAIANAQRILEIQKEFGSFKKWLNNHSGLEKADWVKLFKKNFKFTGGEIVNEFLLSCGYLHNAHDDNCPIQQILQNEYQKNT